MLLFFIAADIGLNANWACFAIKVGDWAAAYACVDAGAAIPKPEVVSTQAGVDGIKNRVNIF